MRDIVGLYLNPPARALVLCVDEKSQIQALDRTRPLSPLRPAQAERRTHDYVRHGTTSLFAALDAKTGQVIGQRHCRHRALEFRKFLDTIESEVPAALDVHLIVDNYATHKTALIRGWFAKRPRFHIHFTPTSTSWLNLVERWFGLLTEKQLRRGVHQSSAEVEAASYRYLDVTNEYPKPFMERMDGLIPWGQFKERIRPYYPTAGRRRRPYPLSATLRVHCVQLFYNLSDPSMEDLLYEVESVRRFVGLRLSDALPDETTILHFRHLLLPPPAGGAWARNGAVRGDQPPSGGAGSSTPGGDDHGCDADCGAEVDEGRGEGAQSGDAPDEEEE